MDAATLAIALKAVRSGRQWKCKCVAHEDRSPSMLIFDGRSAVQVRCLAGCDQRDLIAELKRRGLWEAGANERCQAVATNASHETIMRDRARSLFDQSVLCHGTLAQRYLESREIWSVARDIEDIRFHEACPREDHRVQAIVVAMRHVRSRSIHAVQRIYLDRDGRKDGKPMMLGPVRDCAMMLGEPGDELHIAEGLETALSVMAMDYAPAWAMGSCGAIERFAVLDGVDRLQIWADHDDPGLKAAAACERRWTDEGHSAAVLCPLQEGADFADVWRKRCARP